MRLGDKMRDAVTGFEGVAIGYVQYFSGCNQYLLTGRIGSDGKKPEGEWFDEERLAVVEEGDVRDLLPGRREHALRVVGGDREPPKR